ncbi:Pro-Pol polyprotein [Melipona quadrifasciata]|uniref:RNA-directed DNA polymerase n=1 Tax=Melipona quadrifasciata TaxID=166423 RepID=A0A0N0BJE7_9HYME|nr:Pro-Pol polyprotein [Melipona quadrifasciata]
MAFQIVREAHERGQFSETKTENLLRRDYWIQGMKRKIEKVIQNCILCILAERKRGQQEGYLYLLEKGEVPLDTFHIDHLGPLFSTKKNYKHIFVVVDAFTKFVWLYATKTTNSAEVIERLRKQSVTFGNPRRIISDRGAAFTSREFAEYYHQENIHHSPLNNYGSASRKWTGRVCKPRTHTITNNLAHKRKVQYYADNASLRRAIVSNSTTEEVSYSSATLSWRGIWSAKSVRGLSDSGLMSRRDLKVVSSRVLVEGVAAWRIFNRRTSMRSYRTSPAVTDRQGVG